MSTGRRDLDVLRRKRDATRYRILVEIADRQPAVSQREIAETIGITAQAVSDYVGDLVEEGYLDQLGRGRYQVTKEGVDWLISRTEELREFAAYVTEQVIGQVDVEAAIATGTIEEGERVTLSMREGVLHATPGKGGGATALAVTDARPGREVGVTDVAGLLEYDPGTVTVISVPRVEDGGSDAVDPGRVREGATGHDLVAVAGTEALAAARAADVEPDIRFGTATATREAATRGLDVLALAVGTAVPGLTDELRDATVSYEVIEESGEP